jgi:dTDP-glucose pyrophosphorylase
MNEFQGVILAAGTGSRLYPVTEHYPKPLVIIGDKTLLEYHIEMLKGIGIREIIIVIGHYGFEITKLLGNGERLGVEIRYVEQKEPLGSAEALLTAGKYINKPFVLVLGDIYFKTKNLGEIVDVWKLKKANGVLATKIEQDENSIKKNFAILFDDGGRVLRVIEKPKKITNKIKGCGIYLFDENIFEALQKTPRTALRNEYELTDAIQIYIDNGNQVYFTNVVEEDINITFPYDLFALNMKIINESKVDNIIGRNVTIGKDLVMKNSVVGDFVKIEDSSFIENCVIFPDAVVTCDRKLQSAIVTRNRVIRI